jgi:pre-rRNA-processing protein TSR3
MTAPPGNSAADSPPTIIIRHQKENLRKCTLRGFGRRADVKMLTYPSFDPADLPDLAGRIWLTLDAPPLTAANATSGGGGRGDRGLLLLDATWRHAARMVSALTPRLVNTLPRSIPAGFVTAYPRKQTECPNPQRGLASVEALYVAYHILGRDTAGLLDNYLWANDFLAMNAPLLAV